MLGRIVPENKRVLVVGGGVSGLLAAYALDKQGFEVSLVEASSRLGGLISTKQTPFGIAESAAHSFLASPEVIEVCADLGVRLVQVKPESKARFILRNGQMRKLPLTLSELAALVYHVMFSRSPRVRENECESLQVWGQRHLGLGGLSYLLSPFLLGIYGAQPSELAVEAAFPKLVVPAGHSLLSSLLFRKKTQKGRKRPKMVSVEGGMGTLISALEARLKVRLGGRLETGRKLESIPSDTNVVLAASAPEAAQLLKSSFPRVSQALSQVRYAGMVSCTVFLHRNRHCPPRGVGVLIPPNENSKVLGVLFNSSAFEGRTQSPDVYSYTVMLGGTLRPECLELSDVEIQEQVRKVLTDIFQLNGKPEHFEIFRWKQAIPVYSSELKRIWKEIDSELKSQPGLGLFGNYTGQVSLRGMIETVSHWSSGSELDALHSHR